MFLFIYVVNVFFEETAYSGYESKKNYLLTVVLRLDKPAFTNFSVNVTDVSITANRKSCSMHMHAYIVTTLCKL